MVVPATPAAFLASLNARDGDRARSTSLEAAGTALKLPNDYIFNRVDPPKLIVYACEFARAEPVMKRLRELMNPRLKIFAPRHFIGVNVLDRDVAHRDYFQFMCKPVFVHSSFEMDRV